MELKVPILCSQQVSTAAKPESGESRFHQQAQCYILQDTICPSAVRTSHTNPAHSHTCICMLLIPVSVCCTLALTLNIKRSNSTTKFKSRKSTIHKWVRFVDPVSTVDMFMCHHCCDHHSHNQQQSEGSIKSKKRQQRSKTHAKRCGSMECLSLLSGCKNCQACDSSQPPNKSTLGFVNSTHL